MGIRLFSFVVLNHLVEWTMEPMVQVLAMVALVTVRCTVDALVPARIDHSLCVLAQLRSDPVGPRLGQSLSRLRHPLASAYCGFSSARFSVSPKRCVREYLHAVTNPGNCPDPFCHNHLLLRQSTTRRLCDPLEEQSGAYMTLGFNPLPVRNRGEARSLTR